MPNILDDFDKKFADAFNFLDAYTGIDERPAFKAYISDKIRQVLTEMEKPDRKTKKLFDTAWTGGYNERNAEFRADKNRILSGLERKEDGTRD